MRTISAVILLGLGPCLGPVGCWNGELALHKPCENDDQCGRGQQCVDGFCDGPPAGSTTETGGTCEPPVPTMCEPSQRPGTRTLEAIEIVDESLLSPTSVVAGDFVGDGQTDLAVLNLYNTVLFENTGGWPVAARYEETQVTERADLIVTDLEGDGAPEFVILSELGGVEIVDWDRGANTFVRDEFLTLPVMSEAFTLLAADLVGDDELPELVVSASSAIQLVPNVGGTLSVPDVFQLAGDHRQPRDTLLVGPCDDRRILVPESDEMSTMNVPNQKVSSFRIQGSTLVEAPPLGTDFHNPWALAEGDFLGGDELEVVVAERRLNEPYDGDLEPTTRTGQLRFFRLSQDEVTEVGEPLEVGVGPRVLAAVDLDCDGKTDLVLGNSGSPGMNDGQVQVLFGSSEASARAQDLLTVPDIGGPGIAAGSRMAVGDFDGDGLPDVAIPDQGDIETPGTRLVLVGVEAP